MEQVTKRSYFFGYLYSLLLTFAAYWVAMSYSASAGLLMGLGVVQMGVQLLLFLQVRRRAPASWTFVALALAITVLVIIVGGTLWIMNNLADRTMM